MIVESDDARWSMTNRAKQLTHVDCFSGVGGICTGLHAAGFNTILAIEKVGSCVETYARNHPSVNIIHSDITKIADREIIDAINGRHIDLVTSGMPCETFSTAGSKSRSFYDGRQYLFAEGIRVAKLADASFILFENVPGITSKRVSKNSRRLIIEELEESLDRSGYTNRLAVILNAADYGVPQFRDRYFILASRNDEIKLDFPKPTTQKERVSVADAFMGLPPVQPNSKIEGKEFTSQKNAYTDLLQDPSFWRRQGYSSGLTYHMPPNHRQTTIKRIEMTRPGEGLKDLFDRLSNEEIEEYQESRVLPKKVYIQRGRRLIAEAPAPTVTSHCLDELVHPVENRALTVRECARLQSFPDSYDFIGGPYIVPHISDVQDKYEQIGDAVPPLLAYAWGETIKQLIVGDSDEA